MELATSWNVDTRKFRGAGRSRSCIVLIENLSVLCSNLKFRMALSNVGAYAIHIDKPNGRLTKLEENGIPGELFTDIDLRVTRYRAMTSEPQCEVLKTLEDLVAKGHNVLFSGAQLSMTTKRRLTAIMRPSVICDDAKIWAWVDVLMSYSTRCNAAILAGGQSRVLPTLRDVAVDLPALLAAFPSEYVMTTQAERAFAV